MLIKAPASALPLELKDVGYVNMYEEEYQASSLRSCPSVFEMTLGIFNTSFATKYCPSSDNYEQQNEHLERREDVGDPHGGAIMANHD